MNTAAIEASVLHPFERAGLGVAPFRFRGLTDNGSITSCQYCGTGIRYECHIESADGRRFIVGTDCVMKIYREDNRLVSEVERAKKILDKQKAQARKEAKLAKEKEVLKTTFAKIPAIQGELASRPHPCIPRLTLLDYINFLRANAGMSGLMRAAAIVNEIYDNRKVVAQ